MGGILRRLFPGWRAEPSRPDGYLTWAEIEQKYLGEWVLLAAPSVTASGHVTGGRVHLHNESRAALDSEWSDDAPTPFAVLHVHDPFAKPIKLITPFFEDEWTSDSTPDSDSSSLPSGSTAQPTTGG